MTSSPTKVLAAASCLDGRRPTWEDPFWHPSKGRAAPRSVPRSATPRGLRARLLPLAACAIVCLLAAAEARADDTLEPPPTSTALPTVWVPAAPRNRGPREPAVLVLHFTHCPLADAFAAYQFGHVSAHYTVDRDGTRYQHVDELESAHHAGVSFWHRAYVNKASIGIEVVNGGQQVPPEAGAAGARDVAERQAWAWEPYPAAQVASVVALSQDIVRRYDIDPFDVVGHADVAPTRKEDPGPAFFWLALARAGVGVAYDVEAGALVHGEAQFALRVLPKESVVGRLGRAQRVLAALGYAVPDHGRCDRATARALLAFNSHYLGRFDDTLGDETLAVLDALWRWRLARQTERILGRTF